MTQKPSYCRREWRKIFGIAGIFFGLFIWLGGNLWKPVFTKAMLSVLDMMREGPELLMVADRARIPDTSFTMHAPVTGGFWIHDDAERRSTITPVSLPGTIFFSHEQPAALIAVSSRRAVMADPRFRNRFVDAAKGLDSGEEISWSGHIDPDPRFHMVYAPRGNDVMLVSSGFISADGPSGLMSLISERGAAWDKGAIKVELDPELSEQLARRGKN